jgi:hypothetical protein
MDFRNPFLQSPLSCVLELSGHLRHEGLGVERPEAAQQFPIGDPVLRQRRHFEQQVEMVVHQAVGGHPAAGKLLGHAHQHAEALLFPRTKHVAPIHHSRDAVVKHRIACRIAPIRQPSSA